jgi:HEPN domain-containing protein
VEKYLKAFLLKHNWKLRKIHELDALLDEAAKFQQDLETHRDLCERVSGYYMAERYPPLSDFDLSVADIRRDLKEAREFLKSMFPRERIPLLKKVVITASSSCPATSRRSIQRFPDEAI